MNFEKKSKFAIIIHLPTSLSILSHHKKGFLVCLVGPSNLLSGGHQ
jgi:hypothetical protein